MTMNLVAVAPWVMLLVPVADGLVTRTAPKSFSLLSINQVPGPTPQYVAYGPPEFTTFSNASTACQACMEFFPEKEDGETYHSALYEDKDGGVWPRTCRAGPCDFRDPQTQPVGGVEGRGVGPGGMPDGKTCITRDPVPWYKECEPVIKTETKTLLDVTRYCSYKHQIFVPPPAKTASHFTGSKGKGWNRIGGSKEQCMLTIEKEGSNLMDSMTFCDSNIKALSGCCETVFNSLNCVAETAVNNKLWSARQGSIFSNLDKEGSQMLATFSKYCVPLCQNNKEEFCKKYPQADVCVDHRTCSDCTSGGGLWCPKLESCHCPGPKPPCIMPPIRAPLQCVPKLKVEKKPVGSVGGAAAEVAAKKAAAEKAAAAKSDKPLCKYAEFANKWQFEVDWLKPK